MRPTAIELIKILVVFTLFALQIVASALIDLLVIVTRWLNRKLFIMNEWKAKEKARETGKITVKDYSV